MCKIMEGSGGMCDEFRVQQKNLESIHHFQGATNFIPLALALSETTIWTALPLRLNEQN